MWKVVYEVLTIVTSGISLLMGMYMLLLYRSSSGVKGIGYWAIGSLLIGVGLFFKLATPMNSFGAIVIPTVFSTTGLYLYLAGIWRFKGKKVKSWVIICFPTFHLIQSILFFEFIPSHQARGTLYATTLMVLCVIAIYEMLKIAPEQRYLRTLFRINALAFFIFLVILVSSIVSVLRDPNFNPSDINQFALARVAISGFLMTVLTFGFMSAVNVHLQKQLELQLTSKDKFLKIIAHDLRGSIGAIKNFLNILNSKPNIDEKERNQYLSELEQLSESTYHLLQNLLEWSLNSSHLAKGATEQIELNHLIREHINHFRNLAKIKSIQVDYEELTTARIEGNKKMLETVIRNLLSNALKFTPEQGRITIKTESLSGKVCLRIKDSGVGISPDKLDKIFTFEASNSSPGTNGEVGSGFGLVVCHDFVKKNNGIIQIHSQLNSGTEVILEFPSIKQSPMN